MPGPMDDSEKQGKLLLPWNHKLLNQGLVRTALPSGFSGDIFCKTLIQSQINLVSTWSSTAEKMLGKNRASDSSHMWVPELHHEESAQSVHK